MSQFLLSAKVTNQPGLQTPTFKSKSGATTEVRERYGFQDPKSPTIVIIEESTGDPCFGLLLY